MLNTPEQARASARDPSSRIRHVHAPHPVEAAVRGGRYADADRLLKELREHRPRDAQLAISHGYVLRLLDRTEDAGRAYLDAIHNGAVSYEIAIECARCLTETQNSASLLDVTSRALRHWHDDPSLLHFHGIALIRLGRTSEARKCFRDECKVAPDSPVTYEDLALVTQFTPESPVFSVLTRCLERPHADDQDESYIHATLGKAYLDTLDYERAFEQYRLANEAVLAGLQNKGRAWDARLMFTRRYFTSSLFREIGAGKAAHYRQIIIAGLSRSGKSLVESLFRGVSGVVLDGESKALSHSVGATTAPFDDHLDAWLDAQTPESVAAAGKPYLDTLADDGKIHVTTMPSDIWSLGFVGLWSPETPVILCTRALLDLGITGYFQQYQTPKGYWYSYDLRTMGEHIARTEKLMEHWARVLPNPVYLVDYGALTRDPLMVMGNLLDGLGLTRVDDWTQIVNARSGLLDALGPVASFNTAMPITDKFNGISQHFRKHLAPLASGYQSIVEKFPRRNTTAALDLPRAEVADDTAIRPQFATTEADFAWRLPARIGTVDGGGRLVGDHRLSRLLQDQALALAIFDPSGKLVLPIDALADGHVRCLRNARLGDGSAVSGHPSVALNGVQGLTALDWLLLDDTCDPVAVLEHGTQLLAGLLSIDIQADSETALHRASDLLRDAGFVSMRNARSASAIGVTAAPHRAVFFPIPSRTAKLSASSRLKLAYLLDVVYERPTFARWLLRGIRARLARQHALSQKVSHHEVGPVLARVQSGDLYTHADILRRIGKSHPGDPFGKAAFAEWNVLRGYPLPALAAMEEAIRLQPQSLQLRIAAVRLLADAGAWWDAIACAQPLQAAFPDHPAVDAVYQSAVRARGAGAESHLSPVVTGPRQAYALLESARTLLRSGDVDQACDRLWAACDVRPYSFLTVRAYRLLEARLSQARRSDLLNLASLHGRIRDIWKTYQAEGLKYTFGDFGLPYQGFEPLKLAGSRPTLQRLQAYQLDRHLPHGARALDIGCNHGFVLLGLRERLREGCGFDVSQACVDVGMAVAKHLNATHVHLHAAPFSRFRAERRFDLVIACAVHRWIGVPLPDFGRRLASLCAPGGIALVESQGTRNVHRGEADFHNKVAAIADRAFEIVAGGSLCDDGCDYREFRILRRLPH